MLSAAFSENSDVFPKSAYWRIFIFTQGSDASKDPVEQPPGLREMSAVGRQVKVALNRPVTEAAIFMGYIGGSDPGQVSLLPARVEDHATRDALLCNVGFEASSAISIPA